uniref:Uncharacterized protein n=1 Tax=viral metagenome TaxID=1070528 RepID=A0A6M3LAJ3_9ZZZZ
MGEESTLLASGGEAAGTQKGDTGDVGGGAAAAPQWLADLGDGFKEHHESLKGFADIGTLAKGYVELKGQQRPGPPKTPDEYRVEEIPGFDQSKWEPQQKADYLKWCHSQGFSEQQVNSLIKSQVESARKNIEGMNTARQKRQQEAVEALKTEWGTSYPVKMQAAQKAFATFSEHLGEGFKTWLEQSRMGDDPQMLKLFEFLGRTISEDTMSFTAGLTSGGREVRRDEAGRPILNYKSMQ